MNPAEPGTVKTWIPLTIALAVASLGCLLMIVLRVAVTGSIRYVYLLWNLFLAWIPYFLGLALLGVARSRQSSPRSLPFVALGLVWLFFYPNAPYILTDFIHVIQIPIRIQSSHPLITENALLWYDIILHSAFAFIGHMIGLISLLILHLVIRTRWGSRRGWAFAAVATSLGGYGIYLGRFERLNSWDVARDPMRTLRIAFSNLLYPKAILVSLCFALFIFLTYIAVHFLYQTASRIRDTQVRSQ